MDFNVEILENAVKFILKQPVKMQAKIHRTILLLKQFGYKLPEPHSKKVKNSKGLYELRIKLASDISRLFYFHFKNKIYVVTSGYVKKDRKLDKKEIEKAIKTMTLFLEQNK